MTNHADPRILLAEPDDTTRLFLTDNLAADGYEVQAVADRDAALDQLVDGDADLILVDVNGDTRSVAALQLPWRLRHSCSPASGSSYALWSRLLQWD